MKTFRNDEKANGEIVGFVAIGLIVIILASAIFYVGPIYKVWKMEKYGQAALKQAEWTKQISIEEAKANLESAKLNKEATIINAEATAEANKIVSGSLDPMYINYLIAQGLTDGSSEVIYVPTEASIPIIEAGRTISNE